MNPIQRIGGRPSDIGDGMMVLRALPSRQRRMVGAWCFVDHLGPVQFGPGKGMHVGAHPHIGLQTFTWLIEGEVLHRDSLGNEQIIRPGEVNLMTAGHGVVHTEDSLHDGLRLHAAQLWIALPDTATHCAPGFAHYADLPRWTEAGCSFTLLAGSFAGRTMVGEFHSPLLGLDACSSLAARISLPLMPGFEYGILLLEGEIGIAGERFATDEFAYLGMGADSLELEMAAGTRILVLGGEPFGEPVLMWWNFVGFSKAQIAEAQREWEGGGERFGRVAGDEGRRLIAPALPWSGY
ncbi:quercetin 2,3-dioxygenase [Dechloromonas denitrificans]|uniref:Quercetin 2,3-dioxygenase n=1 Tax=Dechloromonas denitrificans TaxID=281362 RepID=A0A133XMD5_9RHOO|nr:pirin family protein [Dechloromonas denitrificans]KXB32080.1 quercetin 2,3-dioxygenase [Dechloromonas denitrificans]